MFWVVGLTLVMLSWRRGGGDGAEGDGVAGAVVGEGADGNAGAVAKR